MTEFSDKFPLFARSEAVIRADFNTRANSGLTLDDPDWVDTREGSLFWLAGAPMVTEFARAYDRMNEAAAAGILATSWGAFLDKHAESYGRARIGAASATGEITLTGDDGTLVASGSRLGIAQTDPDIDPPEFETTASGTISGGTLTVPIRAVEEGASGNVAAGAITLPISPLDGVTSLTNTDVVSGGADIETDSDLKQRMLQLFQGNIWGTKGWYESVALTYPGVGRVTVIPHRDGAGTVALIVLDDNGDPVGGTVIDGLLAMLMPSPGDGAGLAPVNHYVTVETATAVPIYVLADVLFEDGYALDAADGIALRTEISERVAEYLDSLQVGDDVIYNNVIAQFFLVDGVLDVANVMIGTAPSPTGTIDIPIAASGPPKVAAAGNITLS